MKLSEELKNCLDSDICGKCQYGNSETILTCKGLLQAVYEKIKEMEERNTHTQSILYFDLHCYLY